MFKFSQFHILRFLFLRVLVVGRENRENLDFVKISRYTVPHGGTPNTDTTVTPDPFSSRELGGVWARDYHDLTKIT